MVHLTEIFWIDGDDGRCLLMLPQRLLRRLIATSIVTFRSCPTAPELRQAKTQECFVVMPFGQKPLPDGRIYDFDKVYRVIIKRAVEEAGMKPVRADEIPGSGLIHSDMFKQLRDRPVVLADLSLENPNVFYELGVRHVMSPSGTVLLCRKETDTKRLPFDVGLSRVISYNFDGTVLDWEEVEKTVKDLKLGLQEAAKDQLDSPVHVLLEHVSQFNGTEFGQRETTARAAGGHLVKYQTALARVWLDSHVETKTLLDEYICDDFGVRALGYYCLESIDVTDVALKVAWELFKAEQYELAAKLYAKLKAAGKLAGSDLLKYATTYAEGNPDIKSVDTAIGYVKEVLAADPTPAVEDVALTHARLGSFLQKKWELTEEDVFLAQAIDAYVAALEHMQKARNQGEFKLPGMIAHTRLKLLTLRRNDARNSERQDLERNREAILKIQERPGDDPVSISYLHWAKAIALADLGKISEANEMVNKQLVEDAKLAAGSMEVGGRQYLTLRRFLERYQDTLKNTEMISRPLYLKLRS